MGLGTFKSITNEETAEISCDATGPSWDKEPDSVLEHVMVKLSGKIWFPVA